MRSVSVVIPTYNGRHLLEQHLPAVMVCVRPGDEVMIVDDASTDDTIDWLDRHYLSKSLPTAVKVIRNQTNLRFGETVNRGVTEAAHPYIFVLNNDVSPTTEVITHLLPHFDDPTVFAVGCREIEKQGETANGGKNKLWFEKGMFVHARADEFSTGATAWASGGSAMFDREKWLQLGGFDPDYYPAYWEDVDLSFRARKKGWQVLFEAKAIVYHHHESTNNDVFGQSRMNAISWRNAHRFVWKNGTLWQKLLHLLWQPYWWWQRLRQPS